jgi:hypothetical protein
MSFESFAVPEFMKNLEEVPCAETYPDAFFPEEVEDEDGRVISSSYHYESDAKRVCAGCPLRLMCLEYALETNPVGIWGGTTENERRKIKRGRIDPRTYVIRYRKTGRDPEKRQAEYQKRKQKSLEAQGQPE